MISFDGADSGTNSDVFVSFLLDVGTFVERLWNVCSFTVLTLLVTSTDAKLKNVFLHNTSCLLILKLW
jgi:hypothetical protein